MRKRFMQGKASPVWMMLLILFLIVPSFPGYTASAEQYDVESAGETVITDFQPHAVPVVNEQGFTHPGIYVTAENLNLMQQMVREGYEPWASAFEQFRRDSRAQKDYKLQMTTERAIHILISCRPAPDRSLSVMMPMPLTRKR